MRRCPVLLTLLVVAGGRTLGAESGEAVKFFESRVRPLLVEHCIECHGEKKQKGGLRLDTAEGLAKGGKNGAVVAPGKVAESKLITAVLYKDEDLQMPPEDQLSKEQVAILAKWVEAGAVFPKVEAVADAPLKKGKKRVITDADRAFWSFQAVKDSAPPTVKQQAMVKNGVDQFILAKLEAEQLTAAPEADRVTLIRRAYFDLWGLPPSAEEVRAFVEDKSPDAWERLVDRLLSSPRYGERWARHWLDLVRYAESDGYRQDAYRSNAWPYRDYVIRSLSEDKPYNRFVMEHIAGDQLNPDDPNVIIGTAFLRHGMYEYNQADVKLQWQTILDEVTDVTSDAFIGLSLGCAKCHDHKFDPILQTDYYRMQAFFAAMAQPDDIPLATPQERAKYNAAEKNWEEKTAAIRKELEPIEGPALERAANTSIGRFPPDVQVICRKPAKDRTVYEEQIAQLAMRQVYGRQAGDPKVSGEQKDKYIALMKKLGEFDEIKPKPLMPALIATDIGPVAADTFVEGNPKKEKVTPGYPVVLDDKGLAFPEIKPTANATGRRLALAQWLTDPKNPLTTRVIVNRIWQYHFGRGIVGTSSDYGKLGDRPTHPELLDWLVCRFIEKGWSLKEMHRLMMCSATYRQASSRPMPEVARLKDPENRWLWKYNARRLDAEQIRDAMLAASGELKLDMYGPAVDPVQARRSIYTRQARNVRDPLMDVFDLSEPFGSVSNRNVTTTAVQSLLMINGDAVLKRAEMMAGQIRKMGLKEPGEMVETAWKLTYGRGPTEVERAKAVDFLLKERAGGEIVASGPEKVLTSDDKPVVKMMPHTGTQAVYVRSARADDMLRLVSPQNMPASDFTVEAFVSLDSLYEDASVRVIASQWDGKQGSPGWSFGVTSSKSKYEPRNLILQVSGGDPKDGYEVIPSYFKLDLHKTYYVAVSFKLKDTSDAGVTFWLKDISDMDAALKSVNVKHKWTNGFAGSKAGFVIGGREGAAMHGWDGLIDEVRLSSRVLSRDQLLYNDGKDGAHTVGHWTFEDQPGIFIDVARAQKELVKGMGRPGKEGLSLAEKVGPIKRSDVGLVDLCHVLLNSNGFLYVD